MLKVTNISKNTISIGGIYIKPKASYLFPTNTTGYIKERIDSLSRLKIVKVAVVKDNNTANTKKVDDIETVEETTPKKSNKKSNK